MAAAFPDFLGGFVLFVGVFLKVRSLLKAQLCNTAHLPKKVCLSATKMPNSSHDHEHDFVVTRTAFRKETESE